MKEKDFEHQAAEVLIWNKYVVMRVNTIKNGYIKSYKIYGKDKPNEGFPDLIAFYPPNFCILVETKIKGAKLRQSQIEFKAFMELKGFTNIKKASTLEELNEIIKEFKNGK
jgi:hypothetical protein